MTFLIAPLAFFLFRPLWVSPLPLWVRQFLAALLALSLGILLT